MSWNTPGKPITRHSHANMIIVGFVFALLAAMAPEPYNLLFLAVGAIAVLEDIFDS